ncbi:hypothetical protein OGATHE_001319 [Ogataea polymorpha]|uniref:Uncharacterized protein n=1 Tax=Ogataea polymorpha TaxID=460523 RepID=A0A9P8PT49_9ASCO|nr:hypothetical protein OGATHE_001319 [Ogataea polymorpha]
MRRSTPLPIGLDKKPDMPAFRQSSLLLWSANAVSATIGPVYLSSSRKYFVAERPSMLGICTSINTRSYVSLLSMASVMSSLASVPSHAMVTSVMPSSLSIRLITSWFTRLSSAISTLSGNVLLDDESPPDRFELLDDFLFDNAVPVDALVIRSGLPMYADSTVGISGTGVDSFAKLTRFSFGSSYAHSPTCGSGTVNVNDEPWPTLDRSVSVPCIILANCLQIDSPRPVPPYDRDRVWSPCTKASKIFSCNDSSMPGPVSVMVSSNTHLIGLLNLQYIFFSFWLSRYPSSSSPEVSESTLARNSLPWLYDAASTLL